MGSRDIGWIQAPNTRSTIPEPVFSRLNRNHRLNRRLCITSHPESSLPKHSAPLPKKPVFPSRPFSPRPHDSQMTVIASLIFRMPFNRNRSTLTTSGIATGSCPILERVHRVDLSGRAVRSIFVVRTLVHCMKLDTRVSDDWPVETRSRMTAQLALWGCLIPIQM